MIRLRYPNVIDRLLSLARQICAASGSQGVPVPSAGPWRSSASTQVWCAYITYIQMAKGVVYLVAVMDWYSRRVLARRLSIGLETDFCVEALREAMDRHGRPWPDNSDRCR